MSRLTLKDKEVLCTWLRTKATLAEVEAVQRLGLVGNERFTEAARDRFYYLWCWSADRFEGPAGRAQEHFVELHGHLALIRRFNRVRKVLGLELYR